MKTENTGAAIGTASIEQVTPTGKIIGLGWDRVKQARCKIDKDSMFVGTYEECLSFMANNGIKHRVTTYKNLTSYQLEKQSHYNQPNTPDYDMARIMHENGAPESAIQQICF